MKSKRILLLAQNEKVVKHNLDFKITGCIAFMQAAVSIPDLSYSYSFLMQ